MNGHPGFFRGFEISFLDVDVPEPLDDDPNVPGHLITIGDRRHREQTVTVVAWSSGTIATAIGRDETLIIRVEGWIANPDALPLAVTPDELGRLVTAIDVWVAERDQWSEYEREVLFITARAFRCSYRPPGATSKVRAFSAGAEVFRGHDKRVDFAPVATAASVVRVADLVRVGESEVANGPAGAAWQFGAGLELVARRSDASVHREGIDVLTVEPEDRAFFVALLNKITSGGRP